jgi:hypothetical protein
LVPAAKASVRASEVVVVTNCEEKTLDPADLEKLLKQVTAKSARE